MKKLLQSLLLFLVVLLFAGCSRTAMVHRADDLYDNYNYPEAVERYKFALAHGYENEQYLLKRIATSYRLQGDYASALPWYERLVNHDKIDPVEYFHYAKSLESVKRFEEAQQWFQKFEQEAPYDSRSFFNKKYSTDKVAKLLEDEEKFEILNLNINTEFDEFSPAWYGDYVMFSSNRPDRELVKRKHAWNNTYYLDYYISERENDGQLKRVRSYDYLNSPYHDGPLTFSNNGTKVIFTRNSFSSERKLRADDKQTVHLNLYSSRKIEDEGGSYWDEPSELSINMSGYSCQHPALSADGRRLYFASDMPGGEGGMDLYVCERSGWGWGDPKNLGKKVNTTGDEVFPFVYKDSLLYFSSNGHLGLGGLDVFVTAVDYYPTPINLGFPVNDVMDDFGFIVDSKGERGYFSSNRAGGKGRDDLYAFRAKMNYNWLKEFGLDTLSQEDIPERVTAKGTGKITVVNKGGVQLRVYDQLSGAGLANATVNIFDKKGVLLNAVQMKYDGTNRIGYNYPAGELRFIAFYEDYSSNRVVVEMRNLPRKGGRIDIPMVKDLGKMLNINPIYFDYNKDGIRPDAAAELDKIVEIMKENPKMVIEVASHTDSRGQYSYNNDLSQRRAQSSMRYIIEHGISADRISGRGYGETQLTNQCEDGVDCSEEEHQYNRRTEFRILKFE